MPIGVARLSTIRIVFPRLPLDAWQAEATVRSNQIRLRRELGIPVGIECGVIGHDQRCQYWMAACPHIAFFTCLGHRMPDADPGDPYDYQSYYDTDDDPNHGSYPPKLQVASNARLADFTATTTPRQPASMAELRGEITPMFLPGPPTNHG